MYLTVALRWGIASGRPPLNIMQFTQPETIGLIELGSFIPERNDMQQLSRLLSRSTRFVLNAPWNV